MDGNDVVVRTEDIQPYLDLAEEKRKSLGRGAMHTSDSQMGVSAYILPNSIAEYFVQHGINALNPDQAETNFIMDWLKVNIPGLLMYPERNLKFAGVPNAVPTKRMF